MSKVDEGYANVTFKSLGGIMTGMCIRVPYLDADKDKKLKFAPSLIETLTSKGVKMPMIRKIEMKI